MFHILVFHEITGVLLEPKFIESLIQGSTHSNSALLTTEHCRYMLNDIATCSLMRLDQTSMDKLWNLMTMIYKWQLYVTQYPHQLLDNTFRHLDSIGKLYADLKRSMLVDYTKNTILDFWNSCGDETQMAIYRTNKAWLTCFNTKISLLIRLGFQRLDGTFIRDVDETYYAAFVESAGENIYTKGTELAAQRKEELAAATSSASSFTTDLLRGNVAQLADILGATTTQQDHRRQSNECDLKPMDAARLQQQLEHQLQQCNILFNDLDVKGDNSEKGLVKTEQQATNSSLTPPNKTMLDMSIFPDILTQQTTQHHQQGGGCEFVQLKTFYNKNSEAFEETGRGGVGVGSARGGASTGLNKELLNIYSKMN